jgi:transposase-like protein
VTAGTIFQDTRKELPQWFRAMWWVCGPKSGLSALSLQRILGLGSYETAWTWLHKLRRAMVRPGRERLHGTVEVDETYLGARRRHVPRGGYFPKYKPTVLVAAEVDGTRIGRIRLARIQVASTEHLERFVQQMVEPGSIVITDGKPGYNTLESLGYHHQVTVMKTVQGDSEKMLPRVHRVASLLKRWLLGIHQGAVRQHQLEFYLDEFTFRFNRRTSRSRGKLFYRLVQQAVMVQPAPYASMVGPKPKRQHK